MKYSGNNFRIITAFKLLVSIIPIFFLFPFSPVCSSQLINHSSTDVVKVSGCFYRIVSAFLVFPVNKAGSGHV